MSVFDITQTDSLEGADPVPDPVHPWTRDEDHGIAVGIDLLGAALYIFFTGAG